MPLPMISCLRSSNTPAVPVYRTDVEQENRKLVFCVLINPLQIRKIHPKTETSRIIPDSKFQMQIIMAGNMHTAKGYFLPVQYRIQNFHAMKMRQAPADGNFYEIPQIYGIPRSQTIRNVLRPEFLQHMITDHVEKLLIKDQSTFDVRGHLQCQAAECKIQIPGRKHLPEFNRIPKNPWIWISLQQTVFFSPFAVRQPDSKAAIRSGMTIRNRPSVVATFSNAISLQTITLRRFHTLIGKTRAVYRFTPSIPSYLTPQSRNGSFLMMSYGIPASSSSARNALKKSSEEKGWLNIAKK